jgi:hypothetical protein
MSRPRAWAMTIVVVAWALSFCGVAYAAPTHSVPNSGASHNCVATTSGVLYFQDHGVRLGQDVRMFAPHGGQRDYVQDALQETC